MNIYSSKTQQIQKHITGKNLVSKEWTFLVSSFKYYFEARIKEVVDDIAIALEQNDKTHETLGKQIGDVETRLTTSITNTKKCF